MDQPLSADSSCSGPPACELASGYDELTRVDQALRDAERRLETAHRLSSRHTGAVELQELYLEVLALRGRARRVLKELSELWVRDR
jgi:hypothetical protein